MGAETLPLHVVHLRNADRVSGPERLIVDQGRRCPDGVTMTLGVFQTVGGTNPLVQAAQVAGLDAWPIPQRSSYDRLVVPWLRERFATHAPSVLVTHDYKANLIGKRVARRMKLPVVAILHGYTAESFRVRAFEAMDRRSLKHFDAVVVVSDAMADLLRRSGVAPERVHRIENSVDVDAVRSAARQGAAPRTRSPEKVCRLISVGRLSPEKGHAVLLDALAQITTETPWHLHLVGDGPEAGALQTQAQALGLGDRITLEGWSAAPLPHVGRSDVFVQPSHTEGLPIALLEAMAIEIPIVATRVGGVPMALDEGRSGRIVPPGDAPALGAALREAIDAPETSQPMVQAAAERVRERYGADRQANELIALYRGLADRAAGAT